MSTIITLRRFMVIAALLFNAACDGPRPITATLGEPETSVSTAPNLSENQRPAFSGQTVLKLNPIVERSKAALDRFDKIQPLLTGARQSNDVEQTIMLETELIKLMAETEAAHVEFQAEKNALLARAEYFDEIIFAVMERYVDEAPDEIGMAMQLPAR